jgi:hypothetical protein
MHGCAFPTGVAHPYTRYSCSGYEFFGVEPLLQPRPLAEEVQNGFGVILSRSENHYLFVRATFRSRSLSQASFIHPLSVVPAPVQTS